MKHPIRRHVGCCLAASVLLAVVTGAGALAQDVPPNKNSPPSTPQKTPLVLETYKSFFVGGHRVTRPDGTVRLDGHVYVEAFIPFNATRPPIILTHTNISATIWLQRENGEEGWALIFARAGFPVYVVDPPGTGRAGRNLDVLTSLSQVTQSSSNTWVDWMLGPQFGALGFPAHPEVDATPHPVPMNQMNTDETSVNQWLGHSAVYAVPNPGVDSIEDPQRDAAYIALLEKIGKPVIWMGWSRGGLLGQRLVVQRPDLFRALAFVEGCTQEYPNVPEFINTLVSRRIPMLQVNPDYAWRAFRQPPLDTPSGTRCKGVADEINARGGNAKALWLPDVGIRGNGHQFMLMNNADQIAKHYLDWLRANGM